MSLILCGLTILALIVVLVLVAPFVAVGAAFIGFFLERPFK